MQIRQFALQLVEWTSEVAPTTIARSRCLGARTLPQPNLHSRRLAPGAG